MRTFNTCVLQTGGGLEPQPNGESPQAGQLEQWAQVIQKHKLKEGEKLALCLTPPLVPDPQMGPCHWAHEFPPCEVPGTWRPGEDWKRTQILEWVC